MIQFVSYIDAGTAVAITMMDGSVYFDDASLPADNEIRRSLAEWLAGGGTILAAGARDQVPAPISDRQFAQGLSIAGIISEAEAEEWVGPGTVPAVLLGFVDNLPQDQRFAARMLLRGATQFERAHPLTEAFAAMHGWSVEQTDRFWRDCAAL